MPSRDAAAWRLALAGVVVAIALVTLLFVAQLALGRWPFGPSGSARDVRIAVLHCLLAVYMPLAVRWSVRRVRATARALEPYLTPRAPSDLEVDADVLLPTRLSLVAAAAVGAVWSVLGPYLMEPGVASPLAWWRPTSWAPETVWHRVLGLWIGPWAACLAVTIVLASRRLSRVTARLRPVDLFDVRPLTPLLRQALANALLVSCVATLTAAFAYDFGASLQVIGTGLLNGLLIVTAVLLPLSGVRRTLRDAKSAELAWCDAELTRLRAVLRAAPDATTVARAAPPGRLADVAAYRAAVTHVAELPFDSPALRRLALYLLVPVGSWIASSVVQHLVEGALGGS